MGYELQLKRGDLAPDVEITVTDENDVAVDLTGAAITFSMWNARAPGTLVLDDKVGELVVAAQGKIAYRWQAGDTDQPPGTYEAEFTVDPVVGDDMQAPTVGKIIIYIEERVGDL